MAIMTARKWYIMLAAGIVMFLPLIWFWPSGGLGTFQDGKFPMIHPADDPEAVPVVDASELLQAFEKDREAARKKYQGRIWIRGMATGISGPTVTLEGPPGICVAYVSMNDQRVMQLWLSIGEPVTIEGSKLADAGDGTLHLFRPWKKKV